MTKERQERTTHSSNNNDGRVLFCVFAARPAMFPTAAASSRKRCTVVVTGMLLLALLLPTTTALTLTAGQRIAPLLLPREAEATISSTTQQQQQPQRRSLLDLPAVEQWASQHGLKEHHLKTIYRILLQTPPPTLQLQQRGGEVGSGSGDAVVLGCTRSSSLQERLVQASVPSKLAAQLLQDFDLCSLQLIERHPSRSGGEKLVLQLTGAGKSSSSPPERVETVLIRHDTRRRHSSTEQPQPRYTVCVSSQVGCARACTFCATGTLGLQRQLTSAELLEQVWMAQHLVGAIVADEPQQQSQPQSLVRNVVFMVRVPTCGVECAVFCTGGLPRLTLLLSHLLLSVCTYVQQTGNGRTPRQLCRGTRSLSWSHTPVFVWSQGQTRDGIHRRCITHPHSSTRPGRTVH